ncbi:hypothetical protein [Stenotrophomonas sp. AR026]|uniref:hypothetical protein n=1 Tax=Stenotrophomonas sp. AR026 TaxID=3398462 RepID=UPI003BAF5034
MLQRIARFWRIGFSLVALALLGARVTQVIDVTSHYAAMAILLFTGVMIRKQASGLSFARFAARCLADIRRLMIALARLEWRVHCSILGKFAWMNSSVDDDDKVFGFTKAVDYQGAFVLMLLLALVEIPIAHLLVYCFIEDGSSLLLHIILAYLTIYGLIWMVADRRAVGHSSHRLSSRRLLVRMGWRSSMDVRVQDIRGVTLLQSSLGAWAESKAIDRRDLTVVSPLDAPNIVLEMESRDTYLSLLSVKPIPRYLALFVDEPKLMKSAVENVMSGQQRQ